MLNLSKTSSNGEVRIYKYKNKNSYLQTNFQKKWKTPAPYMFILQHNIQQYQAIVLDKAYNL